VDDPAGAGHGLNPEAVGGSLAGAADFEALIAIPRSPTQSSRQSQHPVNNK
jgi:hypothetical protein